MGSRLPGGKPLVADPTTTPPDSLIILCFSSTKSESLRSVSLEPDSIIFNQNRDTIYTGISATALMPPPWGSITGAQIIITGSCTPLIQSGGLPTSASLDPNHPNPFTKITNFTYTIPAEGRVLITVYDILGSEIARLVDGIQKQGAYTTAFDCSSCSEGTYFARLQTSGAVISRRVELKK
jgi:hypothetical protein